MKRTLIAGAAVLAVALAPCFVSAAETPAPEAPFVEWTEGRASLEDYRGLLTTIVFFDDRSG